MTEEEIIGYSEPIPRSGIYQPVSELTAEETFLMLMEQGEIRARELCSHRVWRDQPTYTYFLRTCVICNKVLETI